jgi:NADPH2:quinone reductase
MFALVAQRSSMPMKALISRDPGPYDTLELADLPMPDPGRGEVRVRIASCSINYPDVLIIQDLYQVKPPRPFAPGVEVSGVIDAIGSEVTSLAAGDRVFGLIGHGGLGEYAVGPAEAFVPMGDSDDFDAAAALLMTYGTAYHGLKHRGRLAPGERLLVLGASGGCGSAAVELGRAMGAHVIAAASSEAKLVTAMAAGAHEGFVYPTGSFDKDGQRALAALIKQHVGAAGLDAVFDPVGGAYSEAALRALDPGGRLLVVGFPAGIARIPLNLALLKSCDIVGVFFGGFRRNDPKGARQSIEELGQMMAEGAIRPVVSARFPLERGAEAIALLAERGAVGKVVVNVSDPETW